MLAIEIYKYLLVAVSHLAVIWRVYIFRVHSAGKKRNYFSKSEKKVEKLAPLC